MGGPGAGLRGRREGPFLRGRHHQIERRKRQRHKKLGGIHGSMKAAGWGGGQASQGYGTGFPTLASPPPRPPYPKRQPALPSPSSPPPSFFLTTSVAYASLGTPPPSSSSAASLLKPNEVLAALNLNKYIPPALSNIPGILPKPSPPSAEAETLADNLNPSDITSILNAHNVHRANYQAPDLAWRYDLAAAARSWASQCQFTHSNLPFGENLALAGIGAPTGSTAERWFIDEACMYNYSMTPNQSPYVWKVTGHFTQFVWKSTGSVGCAIVGPADCPMGIVGPGKTWMGVEMMVCEYDSPGNVVGRYQTNVLPPLAPPKCQGSTYKSS